LSTFRGHEHLSMKSEFIRSTASFNPFSVKPLPALSVMSKFTFRVCTE
jgi:hypothetical protein